MQITEKAITLSDALSQRRLKLAISLRDAASITGVMSYQQYGEFEKGRTFNPTYVVMVGLCRFLECDLNTLGRYIAASQIAAGTITTGNSSGFIKSKERTDARRAHFFDVLYPEEAATSPGE